MAKDWGFILQGYIRVDIYKKKTENRIQETEYRGQKKELPAVGRRWSAVINKEYWNIGMMEEWDKEECRIRNTEDSRETTKKLNHENTKIRKHERRRGLYRTIGPFSCFPSFVFS